MDYYTGTPAGTVLAGTTATLFDLVGGAANGVLTTGTGTERWVDDRYKARSLGGVGADLANVASLGEDAEVTSSTPRLFHYTNEAGYQGIIDSSELRPSLKAVRPKDARYGDGQYLTDVAPGTVTPEQLSMGLVNNRFEAHRFTHYVEIGTTGLDVKPGRDGVFVILNDGPLDVTGRIVGGGKVP